jgi:F0F1-type ATP synthase membrane subunit b/b'
MILVTRSWKMWMAGVAVSLAIFGVIYFTAIKPSSDTANQAIKTGLQQTQQALNQAAQSVKSSGSSVPAQAQKTVDKAQKLAQCVAAAGTDVTKVQACQTKFQ